MESEARRSANFLAGFSNLCNRLVEINVGMKSIDLGGWFWTLVVGIRFEEVKFVYDLKDGFLSVQTSSIRAWSEPRVWQKLECRPMAQADALPFIEEFVRKRFPLAPKPQGAK